VELYGFRSRTSAGHRTQDGRPTWSSSRGLDELPRTPILAIAPTGDSPLGEVIGTLEDPGIGSLSPDEPILRYVDLSTTHIAEASRMELPEWARTVIPGPRGSPLLYAGNRAGLPTAVLAFEPRLSDLPLQVAFPILLANLTGELMGGSAAPTEAVPPGTPISLTIPSGATGISVARPDGSTVELIPGTGLATTVRLRARTAWHLYGDAALAASSSPAERRNQATPRATATSGASASGPTATASAPATDDPYAPVLFAVDLFDVDESTIAPGAAATIEGLGTGPAPSAVPGTGSGEVTPRPSARDELWIPLVLLVLLVLSIEWAVYHRDAVIRIRRGFGARLGRGQADGSA
jgi:hypothetical protein